MVPEKLRSSQDKNDEAVREIFRIRHTNQCSGRVIDLIMRGLATDSSKGPWPIQSYVRAPTSQSRSLQVLEQVVLIPAQWIEGRWPTPRKTRLLVSTASVWLSDFINDDMQCQKSFKTSSTRPIKRMPQDSHSQDNPHIKGF